MIGQRLSVHVCIFFVSVAMLVLQISLTRILSVAQWYHFAFLIISIALFGMGAAGTFLSVFPALLEQELTKILRLLTFIFSLSIIVCFLVANSIPFDPFRIAWDSMQLFYILVYYVLFSIPFFFGGMIMALALSRMEDVGTVYFSSLLGAGIGSILVIPLQVLGAKTIGISAFIAAISISGFKYKRELSVIWLIVLVLLTLYLPGINISPYKSLNIALSYPESYLLYTGWDARSRVDVIKSPMVRYAPGLSYTYPALSLPDQLGITVDGDQLTAITRWVGPPGNYSSIEFIDYLPTSLPFHLNQGKVLVLGSRGGLDVLTALYYNSSHITAVESNPMIVDMVKKYDGDIYTRASVEISESRSFVRRSQEKYDIILLSLTDTSPASTGIYALSENYVFTVEAFQDYLDSLSENGTISVTRWVLPPPRESIRVVSLAIEALEENGIERPEHHIAVIRSWGTITILVRKSEFTHSDIEKIKEFARQRNFDVDYFPGITAGETNIYNRFPEPYYYQEINALFSDRNRFYEDYLFDVSPVTDERPFFFHFFKMDKIIPTYRSMGSKWQPFIEGGYLVPVIFVQALILSLFFILLPLRRLGRYGQKKGVLVYFLCLGLGFMFVEITLIQKFIMFLGHPVYAVSATLFSLLLFAGFGSLYSEGIKRPAYAIKYIVLFLSVMIILYLAALPEIFNMALGQAIMTRYIISLFIIAPLGFLMGMPFPLGLRITGKISQELIPWAWAVNGCASVLGSILVIMIALSYGFSVVLILASIVYLTGMVFMVTSSRPHL